MLKRAHHKYGSIATHRLDHCSRKSRPTQRHLTNPRQTQLQLPCTSHRVTSSLPSRRKWAKCMFSRRFFRGLGLGFSIQHHANYKTHHLVPNRSIDTTKQIFQSNSIQAIDSDHFQPVSVGIVRSILPRQPKNRRKASAPLLTCCCVVRYNRDNATQTKLPKKSNSQVSTQRHSCSVTYMPSPISLHCRT